MTAHTTDLALIDRWQRGFPLEARPFATVGRSVGLDEHTTIATFERLIEAGVVTRIGAIVKPHAVGASTLAAMCVPPGRLVKVAALVSAEPLVNHNYEREHALNLWFVIAGPDQPAVQDTIVRIQEMTGIGVLDLRLVEAYHLDLGFSLSGGVPREPRSILMPRVAYQPSTDDRRVLAAIEDGLPLTERPYRDVGNAIAASETAVIDRIRGLAEAGVVTRMGCIVRHRSLGFTANAMAVWDVPDAHVQAVAAQMVANPRVTLCYRRVRRPPDWRYNLFCMVHAQTRAEASAVIDQLNAADGADRFAHTVLFSTHCFKQRGAVFSQRSRSSSLRLN